MLSRLSGRTHQVATGVCLIHLNEEREKCFSVITNVTFVKLTKSGIDTYLKTINPLDKAGAYAIQKNREMIIKRVSGSLSNVIGLPMERLKEELTIWNGVSTGDGW